MSEFALALVCLLSVLWLLQAAVLVSFALLLLRSRQTTADDKELPKAGILLPLRGADPELADGLRRLMQQDYPDYEMRIVVDSPQDSSVGVVKNAMARIDAAHVFLAPIHKRHSSCSPQCSALIEAVESLSPDVEVVVIVDGDVVTHPQWLRELVTPLLDETVGVAHGNRWFMPRDAAWGSLARYVWNAAAVVPMCFLGIPWAGSFAIRKRALFESELFDKWPTTVVPDAPSAGLLEKMGLKVRFVPSLMMVNRERCSLAFCLDFIKRQMMWTRIYHPRFWPVVVHALATTAIPLTAAGLAVASACSGLTGVAALLAGAVLAYWAGMGGLFAMMEFAVRRVVRARGESTAWLSPTKLLMLAPSFVVTLLTHFTAVMLAVFHRRVVWRGVTYQIDSPYDVRILDDRPYEAAAPPAESKVSL
jgi:cellulose synthase/poly-beta-1,6-N-acetylglucosamine synthase-like glycosyltransferase